MTPYFQNDACVIYHGDCREILPDLEAELVVTDPPYGMRYQSNYRKARHKKIAGDDSLPVDVIAMLIEKASRAVYSFCRWDNISEMPTPRSVLAWVKNNWSMGDLKHEHGRQWEACCFYPGPKHEFLCRIPDVIHASRTRNTRHPTEKPVSLISQIINCNVGDVILDPFMGSGTTLRAAVDNGRRAIGIEIDEAYCEVASRRMEQGVLFA